MSSTKWKPHEDVLLLEHYPTLGGRASGHIPGRTPAGCIGRAKKLGIIAPKAESNKQWSAGKYPKISVSDVPVKEFVPYVPPPVQRPIREGSLEFFKLPSLVDGRLIYP